jgi:hypothetical protein
MKFMYSKLVATAAMAFGLVSAQGALHWDSQTLNVELNGSNPTYAGTFDITGLGFGKGYDPATMTIDWAFAAFSLSDHDGGSETVTIDLGGATLAMAMNFVTSVLLGDELVGSVLLDLDQDGQIAYEVTRLNGSFKLLGAELQAQSSERAVPDTGWTLALLGVTLAGVARFRKA